jgi:hypothetical protein
MSQVRENEVFPFIREPTFEFLQFHIACEIEPQLDYGVFTLVGQLKKIREGPQVIEVASPFQGDSFQMLSASVDQADVVPRLEETCSRFTKYTFNVPSVLAIGGEVRYQVTYREKLSIELISEFLLGCKYSVIIKKTMGADCRQLKLSVALPRNVHVDFAHPASCYVSKCTFERQNVHAGDPSVFILDIRHSLLSKKAADFLDRLLWALIGALMAWAWVEIV